LALASRHAATRATALRAFASGDDNPYAEPVSQMNKTVQQQQETCRIYGVPWVEAAEHLKVGLARNVRVGLRPLNGLRHPPEGDTTGWYIWAGEELSQAADFFQPVHVPHLAEACPSILRFLGLPPGWRFLTDGEYVDVWQDARLLEI
jgi:hypothetical protein